MTPAPSLDNGSSSSPIHSRIQLHSQHVRRLRSPLLLNDDSGVVGRQAVIPCSNIFSISDPCLVGVGLEVDRDGRVVGEAVLVVGVPGHAAETAHALAEALAEETGDPAIMEERRLAISDFCTVVQRKVNDVLSHELF